MSKMSKIAYILAGATIVGGATFYLSTSFAGSDNIYGDWSITCEEIKVPDEDKKDKDDKPVLKSDKLCYSHQALTDNESKKVLADIRIGYFGPKKELYAQVTMPFGVDVRRGTTFTADQKTLVPGVYVTCYANGCVAGGEVKPEDISNIMKAKDFSVATYAFQSGQILNFKLSNKGFDKAIGALKK